MANPNAALRARSASAPRDAIRERSATAICLAAARISSISSRPRPAARRATALSDPCSRSIASTRAISSNRAAINSSSCRRPFPLLAVVDKQDAQGAVEALSIGGHVFIGAQEPRVVGQQVTPVAGFGLADARPQGIDRRQHAVRALHPLAGVGKAEVLPHSDAAGAQQQGHSQQECGTPEGRNSRRQRCGAQPCSVAGQPWGAWASRWLFS